MKLTQIQFKAMASLEEIQQALSPIHALEADLVLVFASPDFFTKGKGLQLAEAGIDTRRWVGCSTAGEISMNGAESQSVVITGIRFDQATCQFAYTGLTDMEDSQAAGERIGHALQAHAPERVLLFGQGVGINGSAVLRGIHTVLGTTIPISGGLAGDDVRFQETWLFAADEGVKNQGVIAIGLSGRSLHVTHGSFGGWSPFGPPRKITKCIDNVLYELDGEPVLDVYKRYLGEHAKGLPASALLFPLTLLGDDLNAPGLTRTILGVDETSKSMTMAGEMQEGRFVKLMHASTDALVDGAETAATQTTSRSDQPSLGILVSCVGRKLVMGDRVDEEVEVVTDALGQAATVCGFYSYGEIAPFQPIQACELHNQTMTITLLSEG